MNKINSSLTTDKQELKRRILKYFKEENHRLSLTGFVKDNCPSTHINDQFVEDVGVMMEEKGDLALYGEPENRLLKKSSAYKYAKQARVISWISLAIAVGLALLKLKETFAQSPSTP